MIQERFLTEIRQERGKFLSKATSVFSAADLAGLPEPVQRYLKHCGYLGKEKKLYSEIGWKNVEMQLSPGGNWRKMECYQFNAVPEPVRVMHLKTKLGGLLPIEARDKYQDGRGSLQVRLLRVVKLREIKGKELDASELVTLLAEVLLLPAYVVQPYIRWTAISADRARAEITWNGVSAHGIFFFNEAGEFVRFETYFRGKAESSGGFTELPWSVRVSDYVERDGIRQPSRAVASWEEGGGWVEYFRGEITRL